MKRNADDGLARAIDQVAAGNFLMLLDGPDGKEKLVAWLHELRDFRVAADERNHHEMMNSLTDFYGLTEEEAKRVIAHLKAGKEVEYEKGQCRKCKGRGQVVAYTRGGCFGSEDFEERCFTCNGSGTDEKRIKVPDPA